MDPQTKLENTISQNTFFHKILILSPYVPTGARPVTKGGEKCVQNDKFMENLKISEMIQDDPK